MRTRTRLTTPPGQQPALSSDSRNGEESYVPGLELPEEPRVPGRYRSVWIALALVVVVGLGSYAGFRVATSGQSFDPALDTSVEGDPDPATTDGDTDEGSLPGEG